MAEWDKGFKSGNQRYDGLRASFYETIDKSELYAAEEVKLAFSGKQDAKKRHREAMSRFLDCFEMSSYLIECVRELFLEPVDDCMTIEMAREAFRMERALSNKRYIYDTYRRVLEKPVVED